MNEDLEQFRQAYIREHIKYCPACAAEVHRAPTGVVSGIIIAVVVGIIWLCLA